MARVLSRSNRPIVIQEAQSGLDTFLTEIAKYASPEYQQQKKMNERADARFELDKQNNIQNKEYRQQQMETAKAQESDRLIQVKQQREDKKYKEILDEVNLLYPSKPTIESLNTVESYIDKNIFSSKAYQPLKARIKNDINVITTKNKKLDSLGKEIYGEDYDESKRDIIESQGSNMLKNKISQDMYGVVPDNIKMQYNQDVDGLTQTLEFALQTLDTEERNERIIDILRPAYNAFLEKYEAQDFDLPAIEGYIKGVDPNFGVDFEVPIGDEKIMEETNPSQTADYIQLANQGALDPKKIIESLADRGEGSLGILETAANEGSVLVPVNKEVRKAVKAARNDIGKASSSVAKSFGYGSNKLVSPEVRTQNIEQLKTSLVNAVNLYKSIDPQQGRAKTLITLAGGKSERMVIKKSIDNLKTLINKNSYSQGSLKNLPEDIKSFIRNIDLEGAQDNKMMSENDGSFLEGLLPTALQASQNNIPSPLDNFILESATE